MLGGRLRGGGLLSRLGGSLGSRLGLFLNLGGDVLEALLAHDGGVNNGLVFRLVGDSLEPSGGGRVGHTPFPTENELEATGGEGSSKDISESETLADEEGVGSQVSLEDIIDSEGLLGSLLNGLLVIGVKSLEGTEPASNDGDQFLVGKGHPPEDGGIVLLGLAKEGGLFILRRD